MEKLLDFLDRLEDCKIYYRLNKVRDAIMVEITVPGQRWEVEFFANGSIEIEKFITENVIHDETALDLLFKDFSD